MRYGMTSCLFLLQSVAKYFQNTITSYQTLRHLQPPDMIIKLIFPLLLLWCFLTLSAAENHRIKRHSGSSKRMNSSESVLNLSVVLVCGDGWTSFRGKCYKFMRKRLLWEEARDYCKSQGVGMGQCRY